MSSSFSFLSWVQNPLVGRSVVRANKLRPIVPVKLNLHVDGGGSPSDSVTEDIAVHGPGDVIGLQAEAVLKTTPPAGEQQFSPLLLPSIEFYEEDLPWRYSPTPPGLTAEQKVPWCFLLTLKDGEFTVPPQGTGPLPAVGVNNVSSVFPNSSTPAWLWAHVQANQAVGTAPNTGPALGPTTVEAQGFLDGALKQNPDLAFSRLLSPRKLDPNSVYHCFLIPAYETGRLAGLGLPVVLGQPAGLTALTSSWAGTGQRLYPVYYQWEFRTGDAGDFESLARLLQPQRLANFGTQLLAATTPLGSHSTGTPTEQVLSLPGIIQTAGSTPVTMNPSAALTAVISSLVPEVNENFFPSTPTTAGYQRPVVAPPAYGRTYLGQPPTTPLAATSLNSSWFTQLNLHPAYRVLAAIGGTIIQDNQEEYMQQAWAQVRDIIAANANLRGMQSGLQTTSSLRRQHLPLTGTGAGTSLTGSFAARETADATADFQQRAVAEPDQESVQEAIADVSKGIADAGAAQDDALLAAGGGSGGTVDLENYGLHLTGMAFSRLLNPETGTTLLETVRQSRMPLAAFSPAFRRIVKPFGRYQDGQAGRPLRPTQTAKASDPATLQERGRSLRQRDILLGLMAAYDPQKPGSGITGAQPKERLTRTYQFDDAGVDAVLAGSGQPLTVLFYDGTTYRAVAASDEPGSPGARFRTAFTSFRRARFTAADPVKPALNLNLLKQLIIQGTRPGPVYLARANRALRLLPHYGSYTAPGNVPAAQSATGVAARFQGPTASSAAAAMPQLQQVQPIMAYPVFKEPMGEQLRRRHPEVFMPNIAEFPANAVTLLQYNHAFIEAYLVGLNHAFGSELLWREYPTDLRGSYFRQFWDVSEKLNTAANAQLPPADLAAVEEANRDITPIASWGSKQLGTNFPAANRPGLVLAVRAELLRRYPNTVVCAAPAASALTPGSLVPDFSGAVKPVLYPVHRASLGQDILLLSFELTSAEAQAGLGYFFVLHERPGEPQFGLDDDPTIPTPAGSAPLPQPSTWNDLAWQHLGYLRSTTTAVSVNLPAGGLRLQAANAVDPFTEVNSSARLAYALFQQPFMVAIHASQMSL